MTEPSIAEQIETIWQIADALPVGWKDLGPTLQAAIRTLEAHERAMAVVVAAGKWATGEAFYSYWAQRKLLDAIAAYDAVGRSAIAQATIIRGGEKGETG